MNASAPLAWRGATAVVFGERVHSLPVLDPEGLSLLAALVVLMLLSGYGRLAVGGPRERRKDRRLSVTLA